MAHRVRFAALLLPLIASVAACGGSGKPNTPPVASFTLAATVAAGTPLVLDGSASSDPDGDVLTHAWSFGNGRRGGGAKIATVFAEAGTFEITLTVDDGRGGAHAAKQSVTVTAGPVAEGSVPAQLLVRDTKGNRLAGVTAGGTAMTDDDGRATLTVARGIPVTLTFKKAGFADQFKTLSLPAVAESGYLEVTMVAREAATTLASAARGGTALGKDGAKVTFPANALVDADGKPVTGPVDVAITPVDVANDVRAFPGRFEGVRTNGQQGLIVSYGTAEFVVTAAGAPVQLAPGKKAVIQLPIYTTLNLDGSPVEPGAKFPVWSLDELTGAWIEEGTGEVIAVDGGDELALRADVTHLSWWNHDQFNDPPGKPKPRCLVDTNHDGVLEDLTGTGYCFHEATPNPFPTSTFDGEEETAAAGEQRIPAFAATASTPVGGGVVLAIPADVDVVFRSWAMNGTLFGTKVIRLGAGVEADVDIVLAPVKDAPASTRITLPYEDAFLLGASGEIDKFLFAAEAGSTYEVKVTRDGGSLLGGNVRVVRSTGQQLVAGSISAAGYTGTATATAAGDLTIEIIGDASAPGSYAIAVRKVVNTTCGTPKALVVPSTTASSALPASGAACFTFDLAADDVVQIKNMQQLNAKGTISLIAPTGEEIALDTYGTGSFDAMLLNVAVVQAGTYRLQIVNTSATTGSVVGLSLAKLTVTGTLDVPGMDTFAGPAGNETERIFVVKKPAGVGDVAVRLDANDINQVFTVSPARITAPTSTATVRVVRTSALVRPLVTVFRMNAASAWSYKLSVAVPVDIAPDTDVAVTAPAPGSVIAYRIEGTGGQDLSIGVQQPEGAEVGPTVGYLYDPSGATVVPTGRVYRLPENGAYTLELGSSGMGAFTARVNKLPAPEALTLAPVVERTGTLALGEVKRYAFAVTQAQVLGFGLSSTTTLQVGATIAGGDIYNGAVALERGPGAATSGARYVHKSAAATLSVSSQSRTAGEATGPFTLRVHAPTPAPTALGAAVSATLAPGVPVTYGYTIATAGRHLLCYDYVGPTDPGGSSLVAAIVWGPSPLFTNYTGDLNGQGPGNRVEVIGPLRVGANTLSLATSTPAAAAAHARLVALKDATPLTLGAAANGTLTECQRGTHTFAGTAGQAYTVRVTGAFVGEVRVHKLLGDDPTVRSDPPFGTVGLGGTPLPLAASVERVVPFTIGAAAPFGTGTYVVEVDGTDDAIGAYSVIVTSP